MNARELKSGDVYFYKAGADKGAYGIAIETKNKNIWIYIYIDPNGNASYLSTIDPKNHLPMRGSDIKYVTNIGELFHKLTELKTLEKQVRKAKLP